MSTRKYTALLGFIGFMAIGCGAGVEPSGDDHDVEASEAEDILPPEEDEVGTVTEPLSTQRGLRPLLVIAMAKDSANPLAHNLSWYSSRVFGMTTPTLENYFHIASSSNFTWKKTSVIGITDRKDASFLIRAYGDTNPQGTNKTRLRALMLAEDTGFPFNAYDTNDDGQVTDSELGVLVFDNYTEGGGQAGSPGCVWHSKSARTVCTSVALVGHRAALMTAAHELGHLLGAQHVYGAGGSLSRDMTVMGPSPGDETSNNTYNFDPWHRGGFGWLRGKDGGSLTASMSGGSALLMEAQSYWVRNGDSHYNDAAYQRIVFNRGGSAREKIIIEKRRRDTHFDNAVALQGVVFWHVKETASGNLAMVDPIGGGDTEEANFVLSPVKCVGDPTDAASRGKTTYATAANSSYRMKWLDGTDTGLLFQIGATDPDGTVHLSWTSSTAAADCPQSRPDYLPSALSEPPVYGMTTGSFVISETTRNGGSKASTRSTVTRYYISTDGSVSSNDVVIGSRTVPALAANATSAGNTTVTVPAGTPLGTYKVLACTDATSLVAEVNEGNNCWGTFGTMTLLF